MPEFSTGQPIAAAVRPRIRLPNGLRVPPEPDITFRATDHDFRKFAPLLCRMKAAEIIAIGNWCKSLELCAIIRFVDVKGPSSAFYNPNVVFGTIAAAITALLMAVQPTARAGPPIGFDQLLERRFWQFLEFRGDISGQRHIVGVEHLHRRADAEVEFG